jgi:flagellar basal body rod protein FlgG
MMLRVMLQLREIGHLPVNNAASIALSGMNAAQAQMSASAHNIANANTVGFRRQLVVQSPQAEGGVATALERANLEGSALEADVVAQLQAKGYYMANLAVFKTSNRIAGLLLDERA